MALESRQSGERPEYVLPKAPTGVRGLDDITGGGLPAGRPTLVCGSAGCGKTLLAMEFLVRGAVEFDEAGVFVAFEETPSELAANVRSLGFDLEGLAAAERIVVEHVHVDRADLEENGEYDLDGLFIRLGYAIDSIHAKRVVLDTIENLFGALENQAVLRAELRRLFRWLKEKDVTAIVTAERGAGTLTRSGIEEYVSDCVLLLDHRVTEQVSTRRLRVVKYRGTAHGTNEYPFLIDERGFSVLPITARPLDHAVSDERISTGISGLDAMLGGRGVYRGSSVLVTGMPGTGKSTIAAHFIDASCSRGERCVYFAFEEPEAQIVRNMRSIGLDLQPWINRGLLHVEAGRPQLNGLEMHLAIMHKVVREKEPQLVVVDPISNLADAGTLRDAHALLTRLFDYLKGLGITGVYTSLAGERGVDATDVGISSLIDTWLVVRDQHVGTGRVRLLSVVKARGMAHSNQMRELHFGSAGIEIRDVSDPGGT